MAVHGTKIANVPRIMKLGLSSSEGYESILLAREDECGARFPNCEAYIWIKVKQALTSKITFFQSDTGFIVSKGWELKKSQSSIISSEHFDMIVELKGALSIPLFPPAPPKTPLIRLIKTLHKGCKTVSANMMHGGFSGSLVLQTESKDLDGRPRDPAVTKIDEAEATKTESEKTETVGKLLGGSAIRQLTDPLYVNEVGETTEDAMNGGFGGVILEMAGACWVLPEFHGKIDTEVQTAWFFCPSFPSLLSL